jgi:hypothetical protein
MKREQRIRPGDTVRHIPSGELWEVAAVNHDGTRLSPFGWPETVASTSDCEITEPATDEESTSALQRAASMNSDDIRKTWARSQVNREAALAAAKEQTKDD